MKFPHKFQFACLLHAEKLPKKAMHLLLLLLRGQRATLVQLLVPPTVLIKSKCKLVAVVFAEGKRVGVEGGAVEAA